MHVLHCGTDCVLKYASTWGLSFTLGKTHSWRLHLWKDDLSSAKSSLYPTASETQRYDVM